MKSNKTTSRTIVRDPLGRALARLWLSGALALAALGGASTATAETHAVVTTTPATAVNSGTQSVAVDPSYLGFHFVYTVDPSSQVQVSFIYNSAWYTFNLSTLAGTGQPVKAGTFLYVDTGYHYLYYVGADSHLWVWFFTGSAWLNGQLNSTDVAADLVGVDSSLHWLWFRNGGTLSALYYNGSAWVSAASGVIDYNGLYGGAVDETSHAVYWHDNTAGSLRALFFTGRAFVPQTLDTNANKFTRPAIHQGTGEVYSSNSSNARLFRELPNFSLLRQNVGATDDLDFGTASIAVNSVTGKMIYNRFTGTTGEVAVLTPSGPGVGTTWTRTIVTGTAGQAVRYSALDNVYGWYLYTVDVDNSLHIVY